MLHAKCQMHGTNCLHVIAISLRWCVERCVDKLLVPMIDFDGCVQVIGKKGDDPAVDAREKALMRIATKWVVH